MAKADIQITLQTAEDEWGEPSYHPGDTLRGVATIFPDEEVTCKHLYAHLSWHTEGRGTRYKEDVEKVDLFQGTLRSGVPSVYEFSFVLPREPWSYQGHYVSIVWDVRVQLDVAWAKDPSAEVQFVLQPFAESDGDSW